MRLLLDVHLSPAIARRLQQDGVDVVTVRDWRQGNYRSAVDDQLLTAAAADERVLVTYDLRTIPTLLKTWAETGRQHAGVILIDDKTIRPDDIGRLIRALQALVAGNDRERWSDRVVFLQAR
jgi:predicted nuclease of predicted toxin-antitoxin system